MLWQDRGVGAVCVMRFPPVPFTDKEIALLETFADQAVIAIQNARMFNDTKEALEQKTATAEILQVISSSRTDLQPVFDTIAHRAGQLCDALFANVFRFDGELIHLVASSNSKPEFVELLRGRYPMRPDASQVAGKVIRDRSIVALPDALADPDYPHALAITGGWRSLLGVPMLREDRALGAIVVGWTQPGPVAKVVRGPAQDLRRPGGDRDRERAAVQRDEGSAGPPDRNRRGAAGHQQLGVGHGPGVREDSAQLQAPVF